MKFYIYINKTTCSPPQVRLDNRSVSDLWITHGLEVYGHQKGFVPVSFLGSDSLGPAPSYPPGGGRRGQGDLSPLLPVTPGSWALKSLEHRAPALLPSRILQSSLRLTLCLFVNKSIIFLRKGRSEQRQWWFWKCGDGLRQRWACSLTSKVKENSRWMNEDTIHSFVVECLDISWQQVSPTSPTH